jgi:hypothetical protein
MKRFSSLFLLTCSLAASAAFAEPATAPDTTRATSPATTPAPAAAPKASVIIGSTTCFIIRECAIGQTPQKRADQITDVFNKYLGGSKATFVVKPSGKNQIITMNKDRLIVVTPQDAKTAKAKNAAQLATRWKTLLAKAFNETKAVK